MSFWAALHGTLYVPTPFCHQKRLWLGKISHATVRMADTGPGEVAEADFGRLGLMWDPQSGRRRFLSQPISSHITNHAG